MESTENSRSALDDLKTVSFKMVMRGYNPDDVDEFLDRSAREVDQLREQMHQLRQQLRQASERINQLQNGMVPAPAPAPVATPAPAPSSAARDGGAEHVASMIAMAQDFIERAQKEAEGKARELTTTAQERAREIVAEARSRAEDEVQRLNGLKVRLGEDVNALARQLEADRARLTTVLSELSRWIDDSLHATPAAVSRPIVETPVATATAPTPAAPTPTAPVVDNVRPLSPPPAPAPTIGDLLEGGNDRDSRD
jgi:cell division initiation protein